MQNNRIAVYSGIFLGSMISLVILFPSAFGADTIFLIQKDGSTPLSSCAGTNGLVLAQNLTDLCDVVIITPMNNDVLQYNGSFWVNAVVSGSDDTVCANVGSGAQVFKDGECNFRTIIGSPDISIVQNLNEIVIDFNGTAGGDTTACINIGTGTGYSCVEGTNVNLRSLLAGTGISITNNTNTITITNTSPDNTVCANVGGGIEVYKDGECNFRTLVAGANGVSISQATDTISISSFCDNTGTGEPICEANNDINSLIAGTGISITDTTGDLTITNTALIGQSILSFGSGQTKTNIGTSYVDIYSDAIESEDLHEIDCSNVVDFKIIYSWDYVGTGNQQIRWVDVNNNANVLFETATFTTDQIGVSTGWFAKPAWCIGDGWKIEEQGKSDVGTDDPQAQGYNINIR